MFASNVSRDIYAYKCILKNILIVLDKKGNVLNSNTTAKWQECTLFDVPPIVINTIITINSLL